MNRRCRVGSLLVLLLGLCGVGCSAVPAVRYFELMPSTPGETPTDAVAVGDDEGRWLGVEVLATDPPYDQERLVYRRGEASTEVGFYEFTRWAAPLGELLQRDLMRHLNGLPTLGMIEPARPGRAYDLVLDGRVLQAEEVDHSDGSLSVHLRLSLVLRDGLGAQRWGGEVHGQASGGAADGSAVMQLMHRAAVDALDSARRQIDTALAGQ